MFALSASLLSSIYKEISFAIGAFSGSCVLSLSPLLLLTRDLLIEFEKDRMINTKQLGRNV